MYHIYVFGDIFKDILENELQLFCTCIIKKIMSSQRDPPIRLGYHGPPYSDDLIFAQPLIITLILLCKEIFTEEVSSSSKLCYMSIEIP